MKSMTYSSTSAVLDKLAERYTVEITTPGMPNEDMKTNLKKEIEKAIGECTIKFFVNMRDLDVLVVNWFMKEQPELRQAVVTAYFNFLYQNS